MPYKSQAQAGYFHTHRKELEAQGVDVGEWDSATKGKHLPKRAGYAKGGVVDKGERTHHQNHEAPHSPSVGGVNDGHGIFAEGGPVRNHANDRFYKTETRNEFGQFLGTEDRFTGGRKPAGFPEEAETEENWEKPKGVGQTDADDYGDCKTLKPVLPHTTAGPRSYVKT